MMTSSNHVVALHCVIDFFEAVISQPTFEYLVIVLYYFVSYVRTIESGMCLDTICERVMIQEGMLCYRNRYVEMVLSLNSVVFVDFRVDQEH